MLRYEPIFNLGDEILYLGMPGTVDRSYRSSHSELNPGDIYRVSRIDDDANRRWICLEQNDNWRYENIYFILAPKSDNWKRFLTFILAN